MEITRFENQPVEVLDAVVCDICGRRATPEDHEEFPNMIRLSDVGGYNSDIGDGVPWTLDMCEECFMERLGQYIQRQPCNNYSFTQFE